MNLSIQDLLAIWGPIGALMGFMWHHSNTRFEKLDEKIENLRGEVNSVEKRLDEKISGVEKRLDEKLEKLDEKLDAVRDRVSRIEGQLAHSIVLNPQALNQPTFNPSRHKESTRAPHSS
jgi:predicted nuclease with TOPRIM domain